MIPRRTAALPVMIRATSARNVTRGAPMKFVCFVSSLAITALATTSAAPQSHKNAVLDLWTAGKPAFGVYAPVENRAARGQTAPPDLSSRPPYSKEGGERLAANPLYDFVFLNLEGGYDPAH